VRAIAVSFFIGLPSLEEPTGVQAEAFNFAPWKNRYAIAMDGWRQPLEERINSLDRLLRTASPSV